LFYKHGAIGFVENLHIFKKRGNTLTGGDFPPPGSIPNKKFMRRVQLGGLEENFRNLEIIS